MRFGRYRDADGAPRVGVIGDEFVHALAGVNDLVALFDANAETLREAGAAALRHSKDVTSIEGLEFLAPFEPRTVRDFYAFESHVRAGRAWRGLDMDPLWYEQPAFYFSNPYAAIGEGDVAVPPGSSQFDFELEVAAIVGVGGSDVSAREGEELVIAYCVMNDWSARDLQRHEMQLSLGPVKGKDSATGLGPWIVTKDELEDARDANGYDLEMSCWVNGRAYSRARWSDVYWSFGEMTAYAARGTQVRPGDVLGSGTCGTGCILELSATYSPEEFPWLVSGDEVVASVERLGSLRSRVVSGSDLVALRAPSSPTPRPFGVLP